MRDLVVSLADLFGAGFQSTAMTLTWAVFYMTKFPNVQKKLQKEIDEVLPNGIQVTLEDKLRYSLLKIFSQPSLLFSLLFIYLVNILFFYVEKYVKNGKYSKV